MDAMTNKPESVFQRPYRSPFTLFDLARVGFFFFGFPNNTFGSVDVTSDCNLRCEHCYFFEQERVAQWSLEQWREKFERMKAEGFRFYQCTWVGGEPLLRPELVELGRKYFKFNTITTNGSLPLPDWKDVSWCISVDGGRDYHDRFRNSPGLYQTIKDNIRQSEGQRITIAYCITRQNCADIEESLAEWHQNPKVRNMVFSFYTPIRGLDDDLWLDWPEKDRMLDRLVELKQQYGDFMVNSKRALGLMKSDKAGSVTGNCLFSRKSFTFDSAGGAKKPCMLGPKADCDRCGCIVPFYLRSLTDRKLVLDDLRHRFFSSFRRGASSAAKHRAAS